MGRADLGERLKRLGLHRGLGKVRSRPRRRGPAIEELLPGQIVETDHGSFFLYREGHGLDARHGQHVLSDLLAHPRKAAALLARDERLADVDFRRMAFIDTETTGLAGGTGTYAFLVGVGVFYEEGFSIHQFFMRDYDEELAMLHALGELLDGLEAVVSFNGKTFDLPLLETRFVMARQPPRLIDAPHLDLLPVARRFWKYRLDSCALSSLETEVLGVQRTEDDVPGWLIPGLYVDYARSGDSREMPRIFYHNAQDILSLVTLTARMCDLLSAPLPPDADLPGEDLYGLARLINDLGQSDRAEAAFEQSALTSQSEQVREMAMRDLAYLLKRQERREEALPWWQQLVESRKAVYACEELAKHYEWQDADLAQAVAWTEQGIALTGAWAPGSKRRYTLAQLEHRLERLNRKLSLAKEPEDESPA
ncbi:MAG: ribonuclease H-like domain-containing protein [Anaerolineae bacterium]|jgi:uncharacterized protein YprB with RNaseH-like and TPR domain